MLSLGPEFDPQNLCGSMLLQSQPSYSEMGGRMALEFQGPLAPSTQSSWNQTKTKQNKNKMK